MEVLAVIPARGGSKGLVNKNILPLAGVPLIAYSIKAAKSVNEITRVIVSTDSQEIAEMALKYGAEVPFLRPPEYARDNSTDIEAFTHALDWLKAEENYVPDLVVQVRPTSPVRTEEHIRACIKKVVDHPEVDSLRVVTPAPITPFKMWTMPSEEEPLEQLLYLENVKEPYNMPRQSLPKVYWQIGYLDVIRTSCIVKLGSMTGRKIMPFLVNSDFAVDIDDLESFKRAEEAIIKVDAIRFS